ncbi:bifunctional protein FolD 4, chloroplastic-like [Empidonax traillii]|uniref:bifunctional protein FolD 4, chloroplastic-like n=1 Tax=Empidonax traillii TaxID=164674 RepID=UPI000FFD6384|nr:bifunctional protein FolD 4, chloroplastic-like [Empidonax traillii]
MPEGRAGSSQMVPRSRTSFAVFGFRELLFPSLSTALPSALPVPQLRPAPAGPLFAPSPPLVAWLRRRFRPWGPTDMAAATTAFSFSFASSSSSALLRPGWAPLRRWRALTGPAPRAACSASSFPRSADSDEATVISGTKLANQVLKEVQRDVESWISVGNKRPHLTVILVGDNPASHIYVRNKIKAAAAVGMSYK